MIKKKKTKNRKTNDTKKRANYNGLGHEFPSESLQPDLYLLFTVSETIKHIILRLNCVS